MKETQIINEGVNSEIQKYKEQLREEKQRYINELQEKNESKLNEEINKLQECDMKDKVVRQAQILEYKQVFNEKYTRSARELTTKQNLEFLHMKDQIDLELEQKKTQLLQKHQFILEQLRTKLKIELLNYEREICDHENNLKIQNNLHVIHEFNTLEVRVNEQIKEQTMISNEELNNIRKEVNRIIKKVIDEQETYNRIYNDLEDRKDKLLKLKGRLQYLISEYNRRTIPIVTVDDLKVINTHKDTINHLMQELLSKENYTPTNTILIHSETHALRIKEILVFIFNEKNKLEKHKNTNSSLDKFKSLIKHNHLDTDFNHKIKTIDRLEKEMKAYLKMIKEEEDVTNKEKNILRLYNEYIS